MANTSISHPDKYKFHATCLVDKSSKSLMSHPVYIPVRNLNHLSRLNLTAACPSYGGMWLTAWTTWRASKGACTPGKMLPDFYHSRYPLYYTKPVGVMWDHAGNIPLKDIWLSEPCGLPMNITATFFPVSCILYPRAYTLSSGWRTTPCLDQMSFLNLLSLDAKHGLQ